MFATKTQVLVTQLGVAFPRLSESLSPKDIQRIGRMGDRRLLLPGQDVAEDRERLPGLCLILRGRMEPRAADGFPPEHRWILGPGDALGLETLVGQTPRHASLVAIDMCEVCVIDAAVWGQLKDEHTHIAVGFLSAMARELAEELAALGVSLERRRAP